MSEKKFTKSQLEAIGATDEKILVIAGAGSGKTSTLLARIERLHKQRGVPLAEMVAITFTNAAANEIAHRLKESGCADQLGYVGTLHGFMLRYIQQHHQTAGFSAPPTVIDDATAEAELFTICARMKWTGTKAEVKKAIRERTTASFKLSGIMAQYFNTQRENNLIDFDGILHHGLRLLHAKAKLPARYSNLFVDEYQDSGDTDAAIYRELPIQFKFFVGDPDQAIYGFRGGKVQHIIDAANEPGARVVMMQENFRCGPAICCEADRIISKVQNRVKKSTKAAVPWVGEIHSNAFPDQQAECEGVLRHIESKQLDLNSTAILLRTNPLVEFWAEQLGGKVAIRRKVVQKMPHQWRDVRKFIALLAHPQNDYLAHWWLKHTGQDADGLRLGAKQAYKSINDYYLKMPKEGPPMKMVPELLGRAGFPPDIIGMVAGTIGELPPEFTVGDLEIALANEEFHDTEEGTGLLITTIHSAKGREWQNVILPMWCEGVMPLSRGEPDEERRVAYVAITRAKERLWISWPREVRNMWDGTTEEALPSAFLACE